MAGPFNEVVILFVGALLDLDPPTPETLAGMLFKTHRSLSRAPLDSGSTSTQGSAVAATIEGMCKAGVLQ